MDGYRQTLLGRALADALQDLEKEREDGDTDLEADGDLIFEVFDEVMKFELHDRRNDSKGLVRVFTHESFELTGQVTAFNRFMDDWSVQAHIKPQDIQLNHGVADLHLPQQSQEQEVAMRLKLHKRA